MINTTENLVFIAKGSKLLAAANKCLAQIPVLMRNVIMGKDFERRYRTFEDVFCCGLDGSVELEQALHAWYSTTLGRRGNRKVYLSTLLPGAEARRTWIDRNEISPFAKLFFILMYKEKAVLLPYFFERPSPTWLSQIEYEHSIWSDLIAPFRALGEASRTMKDRGEIRLIQTSSKILMTTDWFSAEEVKAADLHELYHFYVADGLGLQTPIPFSSIIDYAASKFPLRIPKDVVEWSEGHRDPISSRPEKSKVRNKGRIGASRSRELVTLLTTEHHWTKALNVFMATHALAGRYFSGEQFNDLGLSDEFYNMLGIDVRRSVNIWTKSQEWVLSYKNLEDDGAYRTAFGRLNIWLFIYLPVWIGKNSNISYPYPKVPSDFLPMHHIDSRGQVVKPLSLLEFYGEMDWIVNRQCMTIYQLYFDELADSGLPGCDNMRQPIRVLPQEKAKGEIVKNILDPEDDKYFVLFLEALEGLSEALCSHGKLYDLVQAARRDNLFFDFEAVGFIPFVRLGNVIVPIRYMPPQVFHFTTVEGVNYYNPGIIRFCLFLRWAGPRGQNAQWLDANLYDLSSMRMSDSPNSVDLLFINTDKIQKHPFVVQVFSRALWLLDRQNTWRKHMLEVLGVKAFGLKVIYERREKTKWSKILPLFASDGVTGEPFSDSQYSTCWTMLCLGLQSALSDLRKEKIPLVAWIPVLKKTSADWNSWFDGRISEQDIKVFQRDVKHPGVFDGPYCKIKLRSFSTPHGGGRAGFISDISHWAAPEIAVNFTGQSAGQLTKYNKSRPLFGEIEGAFNTREPEVIERLASETPNMYKIAVEFESQRKDGASMDILSRFGFFSGTHQNLQVNIDSLLRSPGFAYSVCATHICTSKFVCPPKVVSEIGHGNCPECPYGIFSVNNIVAVTAAVRKAYDEYLAAEHNIAHHSASFSDFERERLSERLKESARKVVAWRKIEMSLWSIIKLNQHNEYGGFLVGGEDEFFQSVEQYKVGRGSKEDFLETVVHATAFKELVSEDMNLKMDRAARLLMTGQGKIREALFMPSSLSAAQIVASEIRNCMERYDIDFDRLTSLLSLPEAEWRELMIEHAPANDVHEIQGLGLIARIKH